MIAIRDLTVETQSGKCLLNRVSLVLSKGENLGITGGSGSGKSTLLKVILGMLDSNSGISFGDIAVDKLDGVGKKELRKLLGKTIGFIPQNPMTAFNPRMKIKDQVAETFRIGLTMNYKDSLNFIGEKFSDLKLLDTPRILNSYPSQLSGGMLQRITVSILLGLNPQYILADEPTAALDRENAQLLVEVLDRECNDAGILFVSHDIQSLKTLCSRVLVMGDGEIIDGGTMDSVLSNPQAPWTKELSKIEKKTRERAISWQA